VPQVVEDIPESLRPAVDAAIGWLSARDGRAYGVSAIVDPHSTLIQSSNGAPFDLRLVVCSGDLCLREDVRLRPAESGFEVSALDSDDDPPAEMDPKPGARRRWLAEKMAAHSFVVLLFYRGFW
jgi:hypothetical protein